MRVTRSGAVAVGVMGLSAVLAAGPLSPPAGPVSSTYKTLTEVEPRIAINDTNTPGDNDSTPSLYRITQPGSYYLTGNITGVPGKSGIQIEADNVTIDLNGFTLRGVPGSLSGIIDSWDEAHPHNSITIKEGAITAWGNSGVTLEWCGGVRIEGLRVSGCAQFGVVGGSGFIVHRCVVSGNGADGMVVTGASIVRDCTFGGNTGTALDVGTYSTVENCTLTYNGSGIRGDSCTLRACTAAQNSGIGLDNSGFGGVIVDCHVFGNQTGIRDGGRALVQGCSVVGNTLAGIVLDGVDCRIVNNIVTAHSSTSAGAGAIVATLSGSRSLIQGNSVNNNGFGVRVLASQCTVLGNICASNTTNFSLAAGNRCGQIVNATANAAPINVGPGGSAAATFTTTDPMANLSY